MKFSTFAAAAALAVGALALYGCGNDNNSTGGTPPVPPTVSGLTVAANENSVLSATVSLSATHTDSARVVFRTGSDSAQATPFASDLSGGKLLVLGLKPSATYSFYVEAIGSGASQLKTTSDTVTLTTGALPAFLSTANITSSAPSSGGYLLTSIGDGSVAYATIYDSTGRLVWYRGFSGGVPAVETKQQRNGDITVALSATHGGDLVPGTIAEVSPDGSLVRTFTAPDSSYLDNHEFWLMFKNGAYDGAVFLAYTARHIDLSGSGHSADSLITGHQIIRQDASGTKRVVFDAWDHFQLTDDVEASGGQIDFDHPNAITFDADGNYIVSWRNLDIITKIDSANARCSGRLRARRVLARAISRSRVMHSTDSARSTACGMSATTTS